MIEKIIDNMNLAQIANSGQCFRWKKIEEDTYSVVAFGKRIEATQTKNRFTFNCTQFEWDEIWKEYFDINTDYASIGEKILTSNDQYLIDCYRNGMGVRILKQDLWEMIISYIISQNNNIPRIKNSIEMVCKNFGAQIESNEFAFPDATKINTDLLSGKEFGLGYRDAYIKEMCKYTIENPNWYDELRNLNYEHAFLKLKSYLGIGPKVANCICLFGLHQVDAFPIDTHVKQILSLHYPDGFDFERYKGVAGIVQQYMFYNKIN